MIELPPPVLEYLLAATFARRSLAYVLADSEGRLTDWGGDLAAYGVMNPEKGQSIGELMVPLEGMLPPGQPMPALLLPLVEMCPGKFADIHLFPAEDGYYVLILDKTPEVVQQQRYQQRGNELSLLREKHAKILSQYLGEEIAESLAQGIFTVKEGGERREVTVLFVDIRAFTPFSEGNAPEVIFGTLNLYLPAMIQPILDEKGLVDKIMGDAVMALFGVIPIEKPSPVHATAAALQMIEAVSTINRARAQESYPTLDIGVGIATGPVALGILGTKARRTFSAIGHHVNLAARLEDTAQPREILIDENTFAKIGSLQHLFARRDAALKGIGEPVTTYSCQVRGWTNP